MAIDTGFDPIIGALNTTMNLRLMNQNVISANIANADTPGYKAKAMEFESALREALGTSERTAPAVTHPGHRAPASTDPIQPEIYDDPNGVEQLDGNTVDRAAEMAKMVENELMYNAAVELMRKKLGQLKYAVSEGGGNH
ncbi:flagellar basal body rod protein FlgB [Bdellovibrionota bacterium FG-2]